MKHDAEESDLNSGLGVAYKMVEDANMDPQKRYQKPKELQPNLPTKSE